MPPIPEAKSSEMTLRIFSPDAQSLNSWVPFTGSLNFVGQGKVTPLLNIHAFRFGRLVCPGRRIGACQRRRGHSGGHGLRVLRRVATLALALLACLSKDSLRSPEKGSLR